MDIKEFWDGPTLTDGFGSTAYPRKNPHRGVDLPHALGTPVPSLSGGFVVHSQWSSVLGNVVQVKHDDGRFVGYRHLRSAAPRVAFGERVEKGTIIGQVSDTGSAAYGYHLCTTNSSNDRGVFGESGVVDPWPWIKYYIFGGPNPLAPAPAPAPSVPAGQSYLFVNPSTDLQLDIQRSLKARGRYSGPVDGVFGKASYMGIQLTIRNVGYVGPIDGNIQGTGCRLIQTYARKYGGYTGPVDGILGPNSWAGFARGLRP